jgi:hypothetical protein
MSDCRCNELADEWSAVHDRMPGKNPTLRVNGACMCPTPGYKLELERHNPQGINAADLLLVLVEHKPSGVEPKVMTRTPVDEFKEETDFHFDTVSVVPGGPSTPVQEVS